MDFSSAWQWWDENQLQVLVLVSLVIQCFLVIAGGLRRHRTPSYFKLLIWLTFLGSDVIALYALAAPMLQWKLQHYISPQRNHDLEVLWAPVLLMHLGGQRCISAYNLEDNELWTRQAVISLAKVLFVLYIFLKSWSPSADARLWVAIILLLMSGVIKCVDKPVSLKSSSFQSLSNFVNEAQGAARTGDGLQLENYVEKSKAFFLTGEANNAPAIYPPIMPPHLPQKLFVDFSHSYSDRLHSLKSFWPLNDDQMYDVLRSGLTATFELLYTRTHAPVIGNSRAPFYYFYGIVLSTTILPIFAIVLFHISSKQAYRGVDVAVTFVLLYGTVAVEIISICLTLLSRNMWPDMVAQHNIFRFFTHNKRHRKLMRVPGFEKYWLCMDPCYDSRHITNLVRDHIKVMWTEFIADAEKYTGYTNVRGQWILEGTRYVSRLGWSIQMPLDESVIIWHIATDILCYLHKNGDDLPSGLSRCKEISNYMMHLLFAESEMLVPGSRKSMFTAAYNQLSDIFGAEEGVWEDSEPVGIVCAKLMYGLVPKEASFFRDAWKLAETLMDLDAEDPVAEDPDAGDRDFKMWSVIQGVWVEKLCFSAGRCRGYLHAKSLGSSGGEYLSSVSLLLSYTGMPTLADRLQTARPFLPDKDPVPPGAAQGHAGAAPVDPDAAQGHAGAAPVQEDDAAQVHADAGQVDPDAAQVHADAAQVDPDAAQVFAHGILVLEEASAVLTKVAGMLTGAAAKQHLQDAAGVLALLAKLVPPVAEIFAGIGEFLAGLSERLTEEAKEFEDAVKMLVEVAGVLARAAKAYLIVVKTPHVRRVVAQVLQDAALVHPRVTQVLEDADGVLKKAACKLSPTIEIGRMFEKLRLAKYALARAAKVLPRAAVVLVEVTLAAEVPAQAAELDQIVLEP